MTTTTATTPAGKHHHQLHGQRQLRRTYFNRVFAAAYSIALIALLYHHVFTLIRSKSSPCFIAISISMLIADLILALMWAAFRPSRATNMIVREVYLESLEEKINVSEYPGLDIFLCSADPDKEPPLSVVNTALSVMAFDYPTEKISVYASDDGGSELTLFAFIEAAKFARFWLPFCRQNNLVDRCPHVYFGSNTDSPVSGEAVNIKNKYEEMKTKIESVVEKGKVTDEYISSEEEEQEAFSKWRQEEALFNRQQHPSVIQVIMESDEDKDETGGPMPNLIYLSREKSTASPHHFKAGALNTLIRVSALMTNAPLILTLDCDMFSNDPKTAQRVVCFWMDPPRQPNFGYIQFPQIFPGLNKADTYASEFKQEFQITPLGMDGIRGPNHVGTGCFFNRRAFFGGPSSFVEPEISELRPDHVVKQAIKSQETMSLAHQVARCNYEEHTDWGFKLGYRYGSLVEDYFTGFRLQCEGWYTVSYQPKRPAFLGDIPISLHDALSQTKRWAVGLLQVAFSKYSPIIFGVQKMGLSAASIYSHYAFWPIWFIPVTIYAFIPQLAMLNHIRIFPKVSDPWFFLYSFLFLGAYLQHFLDFILAKSTLERWWSEQRFWLIRGLTSHMFATIDHITNILGIDATLQFDVTNKVVDHEQARRYDQGMFEFGVASPMFVPLCTAGILNLATFLYGFLVINLDDLFVQMFLAGFGVLNCLPIYEGMVLRRDKGRMPARITIISAFLAVGLYITSSFVLKI